MSTSPPVAARGTNQEAVRRHNLGTLLRHVHRRGHSLARRADQRDGAEPQHHRGPGRRARVPGASPSARRRSARAAVRAGPRPASGSPPTGPYVIAVDLGVDRAGRGPGRPGRPGATSVRTPHRRRRGGLAGRCARSPTLIRQVVRGRAGGRAAGRDRDQRPGPGPAQRRAGPAGPQPRAGTTSRSAASSSPPWVSTSRSRWATTPTSVRSPSTSAASASGSTTSSTSPATSVSVPASSPAGAGWRARAGTPARSATCASTRPGKLCHCGNLGCWETEVGAHAIAEAIRCPRGPRRPSSGGPRTATTSAPRELRAHRWPPRPGAGQHRQRLQPPGDRAGRLLRRRSTRWCAPRSTPVSPSGRCPPPWSRSS